MWYADTPKAVVMQGNTGLEPPVDLEVRQLAARAGRRTAAGQAPPPADHRPFGIVDELNCYFDSPAEPNNVHVEIWLPGHLDPDRLRDAVTAMLADEPRAGARRADRGWWRRGYAWEFPPQADADPVSTARWRTEADLDVARARFLATAPPLDRSPPFRLLLARGPGRDSLILNAHHAAFDGRSCLRLLRLIADRYGAGRPAEPDRADPFRPPAWAGPARRAPAARPAILGPAIPRPAIPRPAIPGSSRSGASNRASSPGPAAPGNAAAGSGHRADSAAECGVTADRAAHQATVSPCSAGQAYRPHRNQGTNPASPSTTCSSPR